ncbi:Uncharacterised protein [Mycobacteroides abscessus subsp. abscessus]|nr:Uncharacterised protein [Mycobacteroides abscessus subsp. abscessus]
MTDTADAVCKAAESTRDRRDIVDEIDELVDWQLQKTPSGYDHNINQVTCPHPWCDADWHGLAITARMRAMRRAGYVDPDYRYAADDSEILCPGSDFVGEFTPPAPEPPTPYVPGPTEAIRAAHLAWGDVLAAAIGLPSSVWQLPDDPYNPNELLATGEPRWWRCDEPESLNGLEVTWTREPENGLLSDARLTVRVGGQVVDVRPSPEGTTYRYGVDPETHDLLWVEVHATHRPAVGEWQPVATAGDQAA